jgi:hypothetical protein
MVVAIMVMIIRVAAVVVALETIVQAATLEALVDQV